MVYPQHPANMVFLLNLGAVPTTETHKARLLVRRNFVPHMSYTAVRNLNITAMRQVLQWGSAQGYRPGTFAVNTAQF